MALIIVPNTTKLVLSTMEKEVDAHKIVVPALPIT
jgi:hypothetical protein